MGSLETREVSCPFRELNHDSLADHSVALHRTNTWLKCWRRSSSCWLSVQEDSSQEFGAVKSPRQLAVDLQLQQGGVGQGRTDISSVGKPLPTYFSPPNVRSMSNTNHFHRMLCDILVACTVCSVSVNGHEFFQAQHRNILHHCKTSSLLRFPELEVHGF